MKALKTIILALALVSGTAASSFASVGLNDLIDAVKRNEYTATVLLLDKGMNPNVVEGGVSPLMIASKNGDLKLAKLLVAFGADVNLRNDEGTTALMLASRYGNTEVVDLLLKEGADTSLRNSKGYTSLDLARMFRQDQAANRLRQGNMR